MPFLGKARPYVRMCSHAHAQMHASVRPPPQRNLCLLLLLLPMRSALAPCTFVLLLSVFLRLAEFALRTSCHPRMPGIFCFTQMSDRRSCAQYLQVGIKKNEENKHVAHMPYAADMRHGLENQKVFRFRLGISPESFGSGRRVGYSNLLSHPAGRRTRRKNPKNKPSCAGST